MNKIERFRETISGTLDLPHIEERIRQGWTLAALEWTRPSPDEAIPNQPEPIFREDVPYGLQIGPDCRSLEQNPAEQEAIYLMLELISHDTRLPEIAATLNGRGYRTRAGQTWNAATVFNLLPRLIEVGPTVFNSSRWSDIRRRMAHVAQ